MAEAERSRWWQAVLVVAGVMAVLFLAATLWPAFVGKKAEEAGPFASYQEMRKALMGADADEVRRRLGPPDDIQPSGTWPRRQLWRYDRVRFGDGKAAAVHVWLDDGRAVDFP